MKNTPEFHITIRVRNNRLLKLRHEAGYTQAQAALACGMSTATYSEFELCKRSPTKDGEWTEHARAIADYWDVPVKELFPEGIRALRKSRAEREFDQRQMAQLLIGEPKKQLAVDDVKEIDAVLSTLTPREAEAVRRKYGMGEYEPHTFDELGQAFGVSRERARQIEAKALRKLRHPSRSGKLKSIAEGNTPFKELSPLERQWIEEAREKKRKKQQEENRKKYAASIERERKRREKQERERMERSKVFRENLKKIREDRGL